MRATLSRPNLWHYVSLGAGLVVILALQRSQWFFYDEWEFLRPNGPGVFAPHVGHWSTGPMVVFRGLRAVFGLHSYLPYAAIVTLIHLAVAHLVWRIMLRSGVNGWIATAATTVFVFLGAGAENILWAFQIGFLGAIALGLLSLGLATAETVSTQRFASIVVISVFSLTWAGTAIPLVVATACVLARRRAWRRMSVFLGTTAGVYLAWYLAFAIDATSNLDTGGFELHKLFVAMPLFLGVMFILGFGRLFPVTGVGAALLVAAAVWLVRLFRSKRYNGEFDSALALVVAAAVFAGLTSYTRATLSLGAGRSSRYAYVLVALMLPLLSVALSNVARRWRRGVAISSVALVSLAAFQGATLVQAAHQQSTVEQDSRGQISAALDLYVNDPGAVNAEAQPDGVWAPDLTMVDLIALFRAGRIDIGPYSTDELRSAAAAVLSAG